MRDGCAACLRVVRVHPRQQHDLHVRQHHQEPPGRRRDRPLPRCRSSAAWQRCAPRGNAASCRRADAGAAHTAIPAHAGAQADESGARLAGRGALSLPGRSRYCIATVPGVLRGVTAHRSEGGRHSQPDHPGRRRARYSDPGAREAGCRGGADPQAGPATHRDFRSAQRRAGLPCAALQHTDHRASEFRDSAKHDHVA